jgi:SnoaL-like protein
MWDQLSERAAACLNPDMQATTAAHRWADTWTQAWPRRDVEAIAALYADAAVYRSPAFREPYQGVAGVRRYLSENLPAEENIQCWFGEPIVYGDRAAVEWWGSWTERSVELTYAGVTVLRFDNDGQVVEHRDYDNHVEQRQPPYSGWLGADHGTDR